MIDRTFELLISQLVTFLSGVPQDINSLSKWAIKVRKSYKALRIMEVHKTAEPKFARTLKLLYPYLDNLKGMLVEENNESMEDLHAMLPSLHEDGIILQGGYGIMEGSLNATGNSNKGKMLHSS